jgi:hypothetical protein
MRENRLQVFQHAFSLLRRIPSGKCVRIRVQRDLRGEEKSIRPYGLRIRTDWLRGTVRYDYVFHGVVILADGAKEWHKVSTRPARDLDSG